MGACRLGEPIAPWPRSRRRRGCEERAAGFDLSGSRG
ncbi:hypothetical protein M673_15875 [Aureimonas sp. AU20]|nr:hypothetical protein M673_15875 [Aureimonas sp. AU20]